MGQVLWYHKNGMAQKFDPAPFGLDFRKPKNVGTQHYTRVAMMIGMGMWMWMMMIIIFCDNCCCCHFYHYYNTACLLSGLFLVYTFVIQYYVLLLTTFIVITVVLINYGRSVWLSLDKRKNAHWHDKVRTSTLGRHPRVEVGNKTDITC
jgi:hypothetical protein